MGQGGQRLLHVALRGRLGGRAEGVCAWQAALLALELGNRFDAFVTLAALLASSRPLWGKDRPESTLNPKHVYALSRKQGGRPYCASAQQHPKP